jgi:hypothetical protein
MNRGFEADMDRLLRDRLRRLIADTSQLCRIGGMPHEMIAATLLCALMVELAAGMSVMGVSEDNAMGAFRDILRNTVPAIKAARRAQRKQ